MTTCPFNDAAHLHADPDGCPSCIAHELRQWKHRHDDNDEPEPE